MDKLSIGTRIHQSIPTLIDAPSVDTMGHFRPPSSVLSTTTPNYTCLKCNEVHSSILMTKYDKNVSRHTYKAGVILIYIDADHTIHIVSLTQRISGFKQPFAKGSLKDGKGNSPSPVPPNSLIVAQRELFQETGILLCLMDLDTSNNLLQSHNIPPSPKAKLYPILLSSMVPIKPKDTHEIESAEWMKLDDFVNMSPSATSSTTKSLMRMVIQIISVVADRPLPHLLEKYPIRVSKSKSASPTPPIVDAFSRLSLSPVDSTLNPPSAPSLNSTLGSPLTKSTSADAAIN